MMIKPSQPIDPVASNEGVSWSPLSQSGFTARLLLLIAALAIPFCLLLCVISIKSALAEVKLVNVRGAAVAVDSVGSSIRHTAK